MLYFTGEGFRRLANQNRGHIHVMLECSITIDLILSQLFIGNSSSNLFSFFFFFVFIFCVVISLSILLTKIR